MKVLAIGSHPDDVELGCGGTLAQHVAAGDSVTIQVLSDGGRGPGEVALRRVEQGHAVARLGADLIWSGLPDGDLGEGRRAIEAIEAAVARVQPDLVYTHAPVDSHQDHVATAAATLVATRDVPSILYYEAPTTLGFQPTVYRDISATIGAKLHALRAHQSQVVGSRRVDISVVIASARYHGFRAKLVLAEPFVPLRYAIASTSSVSQVELPDEVRMLLGEDAYF